MTSLVLLGAGFLALVMAVVFCRRARWTAPQMTPEDTERVRRRLVDWGFPQQQGPALAACPVGVVPAADAVPGGATSLGAAGPLHKKPVRVGRGVDLGGEGSTEGGPDRHNSRPMPKGPPSGGLESQPARLLARTLCEAGAR